ncbi:hypothetical protein AY599_03670 [Leptolyngbya valderiana BDU 20041]|nr:hypothetical protein [Geitlerinema sp. CS-897]OAB62373.1 hypothetical protein AY599_03670 [Leptolyngbya valderiana BDU 20041]PPT06599.1 hypothetical protein CKA32_003031 [Geitlerinema sp. FC II]
MSIAKKQLAALTSTALLFLGGVAATPAKALPIFGTESDHDLQMIVDGEVSLDTMQTNFLTNLSYRLAPEVSDFNQKKTTLLQDPSRMDNLYAGTSVDPNSPPTGGMVFSKDGCSVEANCGLKAIGLGNTLKCASSGTDPEAWAKCLRDKDYDAYMAATACTWGNCPGFTALPGEGVYACSETEGLGVFATPGNLSDSIAVN